MNTNPNAKVILCYGDSNTYGTTPDGLDRYPAGVRWTGQLQNLLGDNYYIIEDGLGGRTTELDHTNESSRNGLMYFKALLECHTPVDIVVIMLGTNDSKIKYNRSVQDIVNTLEKYVIAINSIKQTRIILISPAYIDDNTPGFNEESKQLAEPIKALANKTGCGFLDAGLITKVGDDGVHLDKDSHTALAEALETLIK